MTVVDADVDFGELDRQGGLGVRCLGVVHLYRTFEGHDVVALQGVDLSIRPGERVAFLGDLVPTPFHLRLECISAADRQPEETLQTKREVLREAVREGWLLIFSHGVNDRAGYLENRSGRLFLRPISID